MARHSSVSRTDRKTAENQRRITKQLTLMIGDDKSLRFKGYDRLLEDATQKFGLINSLNKEVDTNGDRAVTARRKLREMRDVKYYVDQAPAAGELHLKQGDKHHNPARGSTGRAKKLLSGHNARNNQGKGI